MWQGRDGHRRSSSSASCKGRREPPAPPPRSAPGTCRRPRREVGDRVYVTSPTAVLIEFRDENSNVIVSKSEEQSQIIEEKSLIVYEDRLVAKLRNKSEVDGLEWQEVDIFIGKRSRFVLEMVELATTLTFLKSYEFE